MHISLQLLPSCIAKLTAIEALLSDFGVTATMTGMEQEEDGGFGISHSAQNGQLLLDWSVGFAPLDEGEEPDDAGPCVMATITLFKTVGDTNLPILDLTYLPGEDGGWQVEEMAKDSEHIKLLMQDIRVRHAINSPDTDDRRAFILIAAMAQLLTAQRTPPPIVN